MRAECRRGGSRKHCGKFGINQSRLPALYLFCTKHTTQRKMKISLHAEILRVPLNYRYASVTEGRKLKVQTAKAVKDQRICELLLEHRAKKLNKEFFRACSNYFLK